MQKKLIALAIAGLSGAAFAQSNVTIYGAMDATYDNVRATNAAGAGTANYQSRGRTTMNSSYFGLKGSEDLGSGLKAVWQIENGIGENGGATNTIGASTYGMASRDTYVGLSGNFGTIVAGTLTAPARALGAAMDVNAGATGIGNNGALLGKVGGGAGAGYFDSRFANAIAYISPTFNGFNGVLAYVPNENRSTDTAVASAAANTTGWTLGLNYNNGPLMIGYAYTQLKDKTAAVAATTFTGLDLTTGLGTLGVGKIVDNRFAVKYNFPMGLSVGLLWDQVKATDTQAAANTALVDAKQSVYYLPVTYTFGANKVIFQYGVASKLSGSATTALGTNGEDYKAKHIVLGYEYSLSKRTTLKAVYSGITNKDRATYDFLYGVSAPNTTSPGAGVGRGSDPKGYSFGMRHNF